MVALYYWDLLTFRIKYTDCGISTHFLDVHHVVEVRKLQVGAVMLQGHRVGALAEGVGT